MDYNPNYYSPQPGGQQLPPAPMPNHHNNCSPMQMMPVSNMMHPQSMRQVPSNSGQMQQQVPPTQSPHMVGSPHIMGPQTMAPQQQPPPPHHHPNYHQLPPHPSLPLSASPHPSPHHNHQSNMNLQHPPRPSTGPSPLQHPHLHQQSPHHMAGPSPMHQQPLPGGPPPPHVMLSGASTPQPPGPPTPIQQHPNHQHNQNFVPSGPHVGGPGPHIVGPPPPHYAQQNHIHQHQQPPPPPQSQPMGPLNHQHHPLQPIHQGPPPPPQSYIPSMNSHQPYERGSPYYQNIPQTEFRIIELNKRLQSRPRFRGYVSPLPIHNSSEESIWWERFACDFFDDDATLTLRIAPDDKPAEYTIGRTLIPRFFKSYFEGGVVDLSIKVRNARETATPHLILLECDQTDVTSRYSYRHPPTNMPMNVVVHTEGHLSLEFVSNSFDKLLIKSWRFYTHQCHEYIDRSLTSTGVPNNYLTETVTRQGLTTSTISYLKMCMIMEPMQELMFQHRQTKMDPKSCLKQLLFDKYNLKNVEDNRAQPNKRRKRKTPAATGTTGTNKKSKANANAVMNNNNSGTNNMGYNNMNNGVMSPSMGTVPNISLASQDVMVVGEPSMLGADFGDENERRITRLENNQFDASINNNMNQNSNQMCNNTSNQNTPYESKPNINHMQQQMQQQQQYQNNHETGSNIQMMNHTSNNNNNNNNNSNNNNNNNANNINSNNNIINNGASDQSSSSSSNGNTCLQNNNNHQMNSISMNGDANHIGHLVKSENDLKQSAAATPSATESLNN